MPATIRRNFTLDLVASLLIGVFIAQVGNFIPVVARRLGADAIQLALVVSAPLFGSLLTPLSVYVPPAHRFRAMIGAWLTARAVLVTTLVITRPGPFVLVVVMYYVLMALPMPTYAEVMGSIYPAGIRGQAMSYVRTGMTAVVTLATPLAGWLMDRVGYAVPFAVAAIIGMIGTTIFSRIKTGPLSVERPSLRQVVAILQRDRPFALFSLSLMFMGTGLLIGMPLYAIIQVDELHLSYSVVGILSLMSSLAWMLSSFPAGRLLDRKGALNVMLLSLFIQAAIPLCYFLAADVTFVAIAFILAGIWSAGNELAWVNSILVFAPHSEVASYTALHMLLVGIRGVLGPILGGLLIGLGLNAHQMLFIAFVVQATGALIMLWLMQTYRSARLSVRMNG